MTSTLAHAQPAALDQAAAGVQRDDLSDARATRVRRSLRSFSHVTWLLAGIASFLSAVLVLGAMHELEADSRQTLESARRDNENLARVLEEHVLHTFMNADQLVWTVKQQVERRGLPDDLKAFVSERTLPGAPFLVSIIADESGDAIRRTMSGPKINIGDLPHFKAASLANDGQLLIGEPIVGRLSGKWSLHVARRINKPDGSFGGVASVALDQAYFSRVYGRVNLGSQGIVLLVGADGVVRAQNGPTAERIGERLQSADLLQRVARAPVGSYVEPAHAGQPERLVAYRSLKQYPLVVVVATASDEALAQLADHKRDYFAGAVVVGALIWLSIGLLGWLMLRQRRATLLLQEANERAESANRVKSDFLANMTHELRTPLNGIIGFADCLQEELEDESQRECARIIYSSGCSLLGMVNSVLDMAKIESGKMEVNFAPVAVRDLLDEAAALHGPAAERKGLSFAVSIVGELPDAIRSDAAKLRQILNNLLNNAVKFTDKGRITLGASMENGSLAIAVKDTGCGIAPALHQAIFERFNQGEAGSAGVRGGTGIGLSLARELAHLVGGRLEVESQPGEGAEFRLIVPLGMQGQRP